MATRETVAAADLIPGDVITARGWEVIGYPYAGPLDRTAVPVALSGLPMTALVDSETPYEIVRD
jgi:hypothetical protein